VSIIPEGSAQKNPGTNPVIINEYGYLWLNRDGSATTLTKKLYENLLGRNATARDRWKLSAQYIAAETEFWRCHRQVAGVMYFTGLGYARSNGQTCDNWIDLKNLTWEPEFLAYVHDAFSPIGLMIDFWDDKIDRNIQKTIPVIAINDLDKEWKGKIMLQLLKNGVVIHETVKDIFISSAGQTKMDFSLDTKISEGNYTLEVSLLNTPFGTIKSIRNLKI
jgi:beta-galactosidase